MSNAPFSIDKMIENLGGPTKAAAALDVSGPSVLWNWGKRGRIPADKVLKVEAVSGVSRHTLRPDIFGQPENAA